jgi:hypothetical protein
VAGKIVACLAVLCLANFPVDNFLSNPTIARLKSMSGLVVTEAKSSSRGSILLQDHVPQAVGCAKALELIPPLSIRFISLINHRT